jgi:hypothetical protein
MKRLFFAIACAALIIGIAAGCATREKRLPPPSEASILKGIVLQDLGLRTDVPSRGFGVFFIRVEKDELAYFRGFFEGNAIRVDLSTDREFANLKTTDGAFFDKITEKPAIICVFQNIRIHGDAAEVEAVMAPGVLGMTIYTFELVLSEKKWNIRKRSHANVG